MIKGIILKSRLDFIERTFGKDALDRILPHLGQRGRDLFSNPAKIRATSWYDFEIQTELDKAICRHLSKGDRSIYRKMGENSADFQEQQSALSEFKGPWNFLQMHAVIFGRFFKPGRMELIREGPNEVLMRLHEFRSNWENCETNIGFLARSLELIGVKNVNVVEIRCSQDPSVPYCEYLITWED
jgi:hypothetical protein